MDFSNVSEDVARQVKPAILDIIRQGLPRDVARRRIALVIRSIGSYYHGHIYTDLSRMFSSEFMLSSGFEDPDAQAARLAVKLLREHSRDKDIDGLVLSYYNSVLGRAEAEAFQNAVSTQRHPTVTRTVIGETCKWCDSIAGTHIKPDPELFGRHANCDCLIVVSGYNSRNGILNNYVKQG